MKKDNFKNYLNDLKIKLENEKNHYLNLITINNEDTKSYEMTNYLIAKYQHDLLEDIINEYEK